MTHKSLFQPFESLTADHFSLQQQSGLLESVWMNLSNVTLIQLFVTSIHHEQSIMLFILLSKDNTYDPPDLQLSQLVSLQLLNIYKCMKRWSVWLLECA